MNSNEPIPEEPRPDELVTLSASVILTSLPQDSAAALEQYSHVSPDKVTVRLRAIGSTPVLKQQIYQISGDQKFGTIVKFLRKQLQMKPSDPQSLFCYINSAFAPGLDEYVANLHRTFAIEGQLIVSYCKTVAFG